MKFDLDLIQGTHDWIGTISERTEMNVPKILFRFG
jgi:hypothetical protein